MAENMLGRAARALMERKIPAYKDDAIWAEDRGSILMRLTRDQDGFAEARAALLAALDPEDEVLVLHLAKHIRYATQGDEDFDISRARAAVDALKRLAQGEQ